MDEIAAHIVEKARLMPVDTGFGIESNGVVIRKVRVVGGVGMQVEDKGKTLLFPWAAAETAANCFLSGVHNASNAEFKLRFNPVLRHTNGIVLYNFEWNDREARAKALEFVVRIFKDPPFCGDTPEMATASVHLDVRGLDGWGDH